jgi:hypothetical protein
MFFYGINHVVYNVATSRWTKQESRFRLDLCSAGYYMHGKRDKLLLFIESTISMLHVHVKNIEFA